MHGDLWPVVLAAGSGRRVASVTGGTPKQFWSAGGGPSLLDHTLARMAPLAPAARTVVIVDQRHDAYVRTMPRRWPGGRLVYQPADRGTGPGVLLALTPVLESSPRAIVVVTPSDHAVAHPDVFRRGVREAAAFVRSGGADAVLFGVAPRTATTDYGWITPGGPLGATVDARFRSVAGFVEKPSRDDAQALFARRALWNTMVMVARADTLMRLYEEHRPDVADVFAEYLRLPTARRPAFLADRYVDLPSVDFSKDILTPARGIAVYAWPESIGWSDLGTPDRLERWLAEEHTQGAA